MSAIARFVMRGPAQAALVASAAGFASLLLPLVGLLSIAPIALVTLRNGVRDGALTLALATLASTALGALVLGSPWTALALFPALWLPAWGLGALLRLSRSLALTVLTAGAIGALLVLLIHLLVEDPAAAWLALLEPLREILVKDGIGEESGSRVLFAELARWMTGTFAAALVLQWLLGLLIGRWWQARLYNPGGFGEEFRALRLHPVLGILGLGLVVAVGLYRGPGLAADLLTVLTPLWLLQGLAVIHRIHRVRKAHVGWLVGLYVALVLFAPQAELFVACLGLVDSWVDVRARLGAGPGSGSGSDPGPGPGPS